MFPRLFDWHQTSGVQFETSASVVQQMRCVISVLPTFTTLLTGSLQLGFLMTASIMTSVQLMAVLTVPGSQVPGPQVSGPQVPGPQVPIRVPMPGLEAKIAGCLCASHDAA